MKEFILLFHILVSFNGEAPYESKQVIYHPEQFSTLAACELEKERWIEERSAEINNKRYAILGKCEPRSLRSHTSKTSSML